MAVQAVDALTPLGRGQAQLVTGARGAGKTALVLDAVLAQARSDVRCVFASVGHRCAPASARSSHTSLQQLALVQALSCSQGWRAAC